MAPLAHKTFRKSELKLTKVCLILTNQIKLASWKTLKGEMDET